MNKPSEYMDKFNGNLQDSWIWTMNQLHTVTYVAIGGIAFYLLWNFFQYYQIWKMSKEMQIVQFYLPKNNENEPHQMSQAIKSLWKCYPWYFRLWLAQPYYSFEIHSTVNEITFNIVVPKNYVDAVEKIIHSVYKDAESHVFPVLSEKDYMMTYFKNKSAIGKIYLEKHYIFSLQTFKDWSQDPLSTITSSMTKLEDDQEITLQVMCKPIGDTMWQFFGKRILKQYEVTGKMPRNSNAIYKIVKFILLLPFKVIYYVFDQLFVPSQAPHKQKAKEEQQEQGQIEMKEQKSISGKITQHGFIVSMRIITADTDNSRNRKRNAIRDVANSLKQLDASNEIQQKHIILLPILHKFLTKYRLLPLHTRKDILGTDELASLFHLPNKDVLTPNIKRIKSIQAPPPPEATREENLFGESRYRGKIETIGIRERDLDKSVYLLGKQGTGKSALLENLGSQQIRKKTGATIFMDPAGQMCRNVIGTIPEDQIDDVYYLNFGDFDFPPSMNILDQTKFRGNNKALLKEQMVGILKKEFKDSWGPSTEDILRNAIELALVSDGGSLMEVMLAIISEDFRREYLDRVDNFVVKGYWKNEFEMLDDRFRNAATNAPLNKLRRITGDLLARNILCQSNMTVDLAWLFDNKKHIVVNLAKGTLGEENSKFLGSLLISYIYLLMLEREFTIPIESERPKLTLLVDELQNYVNETVADMLAELRKYGFRMIAGHQFRSQFDDEKAKQGIYQLSRTKIFFNIGEDDAESVALTVAPRFTASDLTSLENYQCVVKMMIEGYEHPPFTLFTLPPLFEYNDQIAKKVIERSRQVFYAGQESIDNILERYRRFVPDESDADIKTLNFNKKDKKAKEKKGKESEPVPGNSTNKDQLDRTSKQPESTKVEPATEEIAVKGKIKLINRKTEEESQVVAALIPKVIPTVEVSTTQDEVNYTAAQHEQHLIEAEVKGESGPITIDTLVKINEFPSEEESTAHQELTNAETDEQKSIVREDVSEAYTIEAESQNDPVQITQDTQTQLVTQTDKEIAQAYAAIHSEFIEAAAAIESKETLNKEEHHEDVPLQAVNIQLDPNTEENVTEAEHTTKKDEDEDEDFGIQIIGFGIKQRGESS